MKKNDPRVSIVIPAYNEQGHIAPCLESISSLEVSPYEVIVVDNMSTDDTAFIVARYPFVTLIKEEKQGVVHARDCGFNYASGDIIGRIDVDTLLPADWTAKVIDIFRDDSIQAVSGGIHFYDIGFSSLIDGADAICRGWLARRMTPNRRVFLYGSNMAIRRSAWMKVRKEVCHQRGLHEDLDLAIHLSVINQKVVYEPTLKANVSARRLDCSLIEMTAYALINPLTYIRHQAKEHRYMYPLIAIVLFNFWWLRMAFKAFDQSAQRLSFRALFLSPSSARVNPAEFM